jgi:hypothetical protein
VQEQQNWASAFIHVVDAGAVDLHEAARERKELRREPAWADFLLMIKRA